MTKIPLAGIDPKYIAPKSICAIPIDPGQKGMPIKGAITHRIWLMPFSQPDQSGGNMLAVGHFHHTIEISHHRENSLPNGQIAEPEFELV